ncbi:MAG: terpene cyclase/mutase family protein [Lentisphaeria bacterium]|nr:terpene cyclase/mutase family protein [Lentisphaeria bacterium]
MKLFHHIIACLLIGFGSFSASANEDTKINMSPKLERAIERGLKGLAKAQGTDGSWAGIYGKNVGENSLVLMAFMSMGNLPGEGKYGDVVAKGVNYIVKQAKSNGLIQNSEGSKGPAMYGHALSTLMLSEAWGQTRRKDIGKVLRKAVSLILKVQGPQGGWDYKAVPRDGDTSVCVMQMFALKSAHEAGIYVPDAVIQKAVKLVKKRYNPKTKGFGYRDANFKPGQHVGSSAAGTCIIHICGVKDKAFLVPPLNTLYKQFETVVKGGRMSHFYYFYYYGSVASYYYGGEHYKKWAKLQEKWALSHQQKQGGWSSKHYQNAFIILGSALPYRYLPIYQNK